jgi:hypothetical protein
VLRIAWRPRKWLTFGALWFLRSQVIGASALYILGEHDVRSERPKLKSSAGSKSWRLP